MCIFHRYCQIVLGSAVLPTSTIDIWDYFYTVCQGFRHLLNKPAHKNTVFRVGRIKVWRGLEELWHHRSSFLKHSFTWLCQVLVAACEIFSCDVWTLSCSMWDLVPQPGIKSRSPALGVQSLSHYFFNFFIFNWRIIALQCCVGLCQASTWITHRYTSLLNLPPTPLAYHRARLSSLSHTANSHWLSILQMVKYVSMLLSPYIPPSPSFPPNGP